MHLLLDNISEDPIPLFKEKDIRISVLRLDKIHPVVSGNKWFKLRYYIEDAIQQHKKTIVTFGGAWSNHIIATAAAGQMNGLATVGLIRGEEPAVLSPILLEAKAYGMQLYFLNRKEYSHKRVPVQYRDNEFYLIAEGGYGKKGANGASGILQYCKKDFTHCCCAAGTGTMMAGLINAISAQQKLVGISVLKNNPELERSVQSLLSEDQKNWQLIHDYHFGGYAKHKPELIAFMNHFYEQTQVPSDFVYTGKLFFAINDLLNNNFFPRGSNLLLIHSGGLQGNASLEKGTLIY